MRSQTTTWKKGDRDSGCPGRLNSRIPSNQAARLELRFGRMSALGRKRTLSSPAPDLVGLEPRLKRICSVCTAGDLWGYATTVNSPERCVLVLDCPVFDSPRLHQISNPKQAKRWLPAFFAFFLRDTPGYSRADDASPGHCRLTLSKESHHGLQKHDVRRTRFGTGRKAPQGARRSCIPKGYARHRRKDSAGQKLGFLFVAQVGEQNSGRPQIGQIATPGDRVVSGPQ